MADKAQNKTATEAFLAGDYMTAAWMFSIEIELLEKDNPEPAVLAQKYANRAFCFLSTGYLRSTLVDAGHCTRILPEWSQGHALLGAALLRMRRYDEARAALTTALALQPTALTYHRLDLCDVLPHVNFLDVISGKSEAVEAVCDRLHEHGFIILRVPEGITQCIQDFTTACRKFFSLSDSTKNGFRTTTHQAYLTPYPGTHEIFEFKQNNRDEDYCVPPILEKSQAAAYSILEMIAKTIFSLMAQRVCTSKSSNDWISLLDDSTHRVVNYDRVPGRVQTGKGSLPAPKEAFDSQFVEQVQTFFQDHTDSSLITIAPPSTEPGLDIKSLATLRWYNIEQHMTQNDFFVFCGDSTSRLSNNYYPALLHRPSAKPLMEAKESRISLPFFLRARLDAMLETSLLDTTIVGEISEIIREPLLMGDLNDNVNECRDNWPWKCNGDYFSSMRYSQ